MRNDSRVRCSVDPRRTSWDDPAPAGLSEPHMTVNDQILLGHILKQRHAELAQELSDADFFEVFVTEQVLKDFDISYDEIESGIVDGGGDGGMDSIFTFINGELLQEDTEYQTLKSDIKIEFIIIQAKTTDGFKESAVDKLTSSAGDLLDLSQELSSLKTVYNDKVLDIFGRFRTAYTSLAARLPKLKLSYFYATKAIDVHQNTERKVKQLETAIRRHLSASEFTFEFLGAPRLLAMARRAPATTINLTLAENPISTANVAFIGLARLLDFKAFITAEGGRLRREMFEANVRDYQGSTEVNDDIKRSLASSGAEDFWWLNNGITIIATHATHSGKLLTIKEPQIVNGLQTSTEIYNFFSTNKTNQDDRMVLVRVLVPGDGASSDRIIKATNSQTAIPAASLRATDKVQRDIEQFFSANGYYYDRRKNLHRNAGRPKARIIGIPYLAQAVTAILLQEPHNARGKPSTLIKKDDDYARIFNPAYDIKLFLQCAVFMRSIDLFIKTIELDELENKDRNNIKYHLAMYAMALMARGRNLHPDDIVVLDQAQITPQFLSECLKPVLQVYAHLGASDQVAKRSTFGEDLKRLAKEQVAVRLRRSAARPTAKKDGPSPSKGKARTK